MHMLHVFLFQTADKMKQILLFEIKTRHLVIMVCLFHIYPGQKKLLVLHYYDDDDGNDEKKRKAEKRRIMKRK